MIAVASPAKRGGKLLGDFQRKKIGICFNIDDRRLTRRGILSVSYCLWRGLGDVRDLQVRRQVAYIISSFHVSRRCCQSYLEASRVYECP